MRTLIVALACGLMWSSKPAWSDEPAATKEPSPPQPAPSVPADPSADGQPANERPRAAEPSASEIAQWIGQLDSDKFVERDQASRKLVAAGKTALPALNEALGSKSREVANRAFEIIAGHLNAPDAALKEAARAMLEQLSKSDAPLARRAAALLKPEPPPATGRGFGRPGRIQIGGGGALNIQAGGRKVQIRNENGKKTIDAEENGRKVHIVEDPQNGIAVRVTEKKGEKEETSDYAAPTLDELKKKHPEAAKLYETYNQGLGGGLNIQLQAGAPLLPPAFLPQLAPPQGAPKHDATAEVAAARKALSAARDQLKKQANSPAPADIARAVAELDAVDKKLQSALEKLEED